MSDLRKQIRIEQTLGDAERLQNEFDDWKTRREKADKEKNQYRTQLQALQQVITRALGDTRTDTQAILASNPGVGEVYERCRLQERRMMWIRRVLWGYYREKFDQRDQSDDLRRLLETADDVVWSCYREALYQGAPNQPLNPIPLAYIEPFYSPRALPRDEPPGLLKEKRLGDRFLADFFTRLPIPLISLPPNCLHSPWWLIYLGHEVGHHVQHDLDLVDLFQDLLLEAATSDPPPKEDESSAGRWVDWGQEIFADVFSVYMMGSSAVWAMAELETLPDRDMMSRKDSYPPAAARLGLLACVADELGLDGAGALRGQTPDWWLARRPADPFEAELHKELSADLAMIKKLSGILTRIQLGTPGPFRKLTAWNGSDFSPAGEMVEWREALVNGRQRQAQQRLSSARIIVSAGIEVWRAITASSRKINRAEALDLLGGRLLEAIEQNRDKTTREADSQAVKNVDDVAADLSQELRHAEFFDW